MTTLNELEISYYPDTDTLLLTAAPPPWAMGETIARDLMVSLDNNGQVQSATIEYASRWLLPLLYGASQYGQSHPATNKVAGQPPRSYEVWDAPLEKATDPALVLEYNPRQDSLLLFGDAIRQDAGTPVEVANGLTAFVTENSVLGLRIEQVAERLRPYLPVSGVATR